MILEPGFISEEEYALLSKDDKKKYYNACFAKISGIKVEIVGYCYGLWSDRMAETERIRKLRPWKPEYSLPYENKKEENKKHYPKKEG